MKKAVFLLALLCLVGGAVFAEESPFTLPPSAGGSGITSIPDPLTIGTLSVSSLTTNGTIRSTGHTNLPPGSGEGVEISYSAGEGGIVSYDRTNNIQKPFIIGGNPIYMNPGVPTGNIYLVSQNTNKVGIGTETPDAKLDVNGDIKASTLTVAAIVVTGTMTVKATSVLAATPGTGLVLTSGFGSPVMVTNANSGLVEGRDSLGEFSGETFTAASTKTVMACVQGYFMNNSPSSATVWVAISKNHETTDRGGSGWMGSLNLATARGYTGSGGFAIVQNDVCSDFDMAPGDTLNVYTWTDNTGIGGAYTLAEGVRLSIVGIPNSVTDSTGTEISSPEAPPEEPPE